MANNIETGYQKDLRGQKAKIILGLVISLIILAFGLLLSNIFMMLGALAGTVLTIAALVILRKQTKNIENYVPKKGFEFFRKSPEDKIKTFTTAQIILVIVTIFGIILGAVGQSLSIGLGAVLTIQFLIKRRIKLHVPIDDASYFELEALNIIGRKDIVKTLYKDFESWNDANEGSKVLLVTQDSLICVNFHNRNEASKLVCPLSKINKLAIMATGEAAEAYLVTIGYSNTFIKLKLEGESCQDSPEEFISYFLKELDRCLLGKQRSESRTAAPAQPPQEKNPSAMGFQVNIREIDFAEESTNSPINNVSANTDQTNARFIEL